MKNSKTDSTDLSRTPLLRISLNEAEILADLQYPAPVDESAVERVRQDRSRARTGNNSR